MNFSLSVHGSPYGSQAGASALAFAGAAIEQGHDVNRVFFYNDGVYAGNFLTTPPQDECNLQTTWAELAEQHKIELIVCVAAALRRGMVNEEEANRYNQQQFVIKPPFELSGLGQLVENLILCDQHITFGS